MLCIILLKSNFIKQVYIFNCVYMIRKAINPWDNVKLSPSLINSLKMFVITILLI